MKSISEMTAEEKNREMRGYLEIPYHETFWCPKCGYANVEGGPPFCFCNPPIKETKRLRGHRKNHDFVKDPVSLLREMMKREDWFQFKSFSFDISTPFMFLEDYITDQTGKLLDACLEWFRKEKE